MISSPSIIAKTLSAVVIAGVVAVLCGQPAMAQTAKKLNCTGCIKSKHLKKNAITGGKVKNNSLTGADVRDGSIKGGDLAGGTVTQDKLGADVTGPLQKGSKAAGQSCLAGEFVTGFDFDGNIICSGGGGGGGGGSSEVLLQNDSFVSGGTFSVQQGFVAGEEGAATLGPIVSTGTLETVQLLFPGPAVTTVVTLKIYQDPGTAEPGVLLFSDTFMLFPSNTTLQEIDLSAENVVVNGGSAIRVSILFDVLPAGVGLATDAGSAVSNRNWIKASGIGWVSTASFGVVGNWILRATVASL